MTLITAAEPIGPHQERLGAHRLDRRAVAFVECGIAADQCGDLAGRGKMHATGHRAFQRLDALGRGNVGKADDLVAAVGRHLDPCAALGQPFQQAVGAGKHRLADLRRGQAGDGVAGLAGGFGGA